MAVLAGVGACVSGTKAKPLKPLTLLPVVVVAGGGACVSGRSGAFETPGIVRSATVFGRACMVLVCVFRAPRGLRPCRTRRSTLLSRPPSQGGEQQNSPPRGDVTVQ